MVGREARRSCGARLSTSLGGKPPLPREGGAGGGCERRRARRPPPLPVIPASFANPSQSRFRFRLNEATSPHPPETEMRYPIAIESGTGTTAFGVVVPDLPGCFSAGDTLDEALAGAEEAAAAWGRCRARRGRRDPPAVEPRRAAAQPRLCRLDLRRDHARPRPARRHHRTRQHHPTPPSSQAARRHGSRSRRSTARRRSGIM